MSLFVNAMAMCFFFKSNVFCLPCWMFIYGPCHGVKERASFYLSFFSFLCVALDKGMSKLILFCFYFFLFGVFGVFGVSSNAVIWKPFSHSLTDLSSIGSFLFLQSLFLCSRSQLPFASLSYCTFMLTLVLVLVLLLTSQHTLSSFSAMPCV